MHGLTKVDLLFSHYAEKVFSHYARCFLAPSYYAQTELCQHMHIPPKPSQSCTEGICHSSTHLLCHCMWRVLYQCMHASYKHCMGENSWEWGYSKSRDKEMRNEIKKWGNEEDMEMHGSPNVCRESRVLDNRCNPTPPTLSPHEYGPI